MCENRNLATTGRHSVLLSQFRRASSGVVFGIAMRALISFNTDGAAKYPICHEVDRPFTLADKSVRYWPESCLPPPREGHCPLSLTSRFERATTVSGPGPAGAKEEGQRGLPGLAGQLQVHY